MSWGALNICSEGHSIHHNVDQAAGAKYGVRYPYEFDSRGLRFWSTPMGAVLDHGRLGRSWEVTSWLYQKNVSPTPTITYEKPASAPDPAVHISTLAGYDVSEDGPYFATFKNQCDRIWYGQNAKYSYSYVAGNYVLNIGTGGWLRPGKGVKSNVKSAQNHYEQRPFMAPTMPYDFAKTPGDWPNLQTKRGMGAWVRDGWAYKKATPNLNDHSQHEFNWPDGGDPEWDYDDIWDVSPNPTDGLDLNLLYLVEKRYSHGPNCDKCHIPFTARRCNDRILTGYQPHYWFTTGTTPQHFSADHLLKSWCVEDNYPYISGGGYGYKYGWAPYSISCEETAFQRFRDITRNDGPEDEPWYAKTDLYNQITSGYRMVDGYEALSEIIPPNTAFDLMIYLQVVNYLICERELTEPAGSYPYYKKIAAGYFNTKCYCLLHQIAPLIPKP
jgi:hypothetical protein